MDIREALADALELMADPPSCISDSDDRRTALLAAAELRKACATCRHWTKNHPDPRFHTAHYCFAKGMYRGNQPEDGSGFCHRWEAKP